LLRHRRAKGAVAFAHFAPFLRPALIDGAVGAIFAPGGRLERVVRFAIKNDKIHHVETLPTQPAWKHWTWLWLTCRRKLASNHAGSSGQPGKARQDFSN
jgi:hypothetical protein